MAVKANGALQPDCYVETIRTALLGAGAMFPLYHYDARKSVELWPREFLSPSELLPLNEQGWFGHLRVKLPARPCVYLRRAYGADCFESFKIATSHIDWSRDIRERLRAAREAAQAAGDHCTLHMLSGAATPLQEEHYLPLQHSSRDKRVWSGHDISAVRLTVAREDAMLNHAPLTNTFTKDSQDELGSSKSPADALHAPAATAAASASCAIPAVLSPAILISSSLVSPTPTETDAEATTAPISTAAWSSSTKSAMIIAATETCSSVTAIVPSATPRPPPKTGWFGAAMAVATCNSPQAFEFTPALLETMSPHCLKARNLRTMRQAEQRFSPRVLAGLEDPTFLSLTNETVLTYDTLAFDLPFHLAQALGLPVNLPLCQFHEYATGVSGGKDALLARLREPSHRAVFHTVFDELVRKVVLPHVALSAGVHTPVYYQVRCAWKLERCQCASSCSTHTCLYSVCLFAHVLFFYPGESVSVLSCGRFSPVFESSNRLNFHWACIVMPATVLLLPM